MQSPIQIVFRDVPPSSVVERSIQAEAAKLEHYFDGIIGCRVVVSEPHRHHRKGKLYAVEINLSVPGETLMVSHEHRQHPGHENVYLAVQEAFHAARRELEDYVRRMRLLIKTPQPRPSQKLGSVIARLATKAK